MKISSFIKLVTVIIALYASAFISIKAAYIETSCEVKFPTPDPNVTFCSGGIMIVKKDAVTLVDYILEPKSGKYINAKFQVISKDEGDLVVWQDRRQVTTKYEGRTPVMSEVYDRRIRPKISEISGQGRVYILVKCQDC